MARDKLNCYRYVTIIETIYLCENKWGVVCLKMLTKNH